MQPRNPVNWKAAALPLAAFTVALTVGIAYFAGSDRGGEGHQGAPASDVSFGSAGPHYAPDSPAARRLKAGGGESSIDMFKRVNENFSSEIAPAAAKAAPKAASKPRTKQEMTEFMQQLRADINMDLAAQAAAEAAASQGGQAGAAGYSGGAGMRANLGQEKQAAATSVQGRKTAAGSSRGDSSLKSRKTAFSTGRTTAGMSRTGGLSRQGSFGSSSGDSDMAGSASGETGHAFVSGSGHNFEAGAYNTQGSAGAPASASGAGASAEGPRTMGGGAKEEKLPPAPVAFIWPRSTDFGTMYTYETAVRQIIVMNIGDADLKLGSISNLDGDTPFYIERDKCSKKVIKPNNSCTFRVRFSPRSNREYLTGFEIPNNDTNGIAYQSYIEVKGISKHSSYTWWWNQWNHTGGSANRLEFGLVPVGWTMDQELKITNNSGNSWRDIKLDKSALTGAFSITSDGCSGQSIGPRQTCTLKVLFKPSDSVNRSFGNSHYGQYHSVNMETGAKLYHSRPHFPPNLMEKPVEVKVKGILKVKAKYDEEYWNGSHDVLSVPLNAVSTAQFPVMGLVRVQHYYYFK